MLLCAHLNDADDVRLISDRVVRAIRAPMTIAGAELTVTGSVGVVLTADPNVAPGELLRQADVALYDAKRAGNGNRFEMFDAELHLRGEATASLAAELALAVERSELFVLYQPLFRLEDGALVGAEALVRWRHPQRGVLLPDEFIAHAERRGLIEKIDSFVLDEACRQLAEWGAGDDPWDVLHDLCATSPATSCATADWSSGLPARSNAIGSRRRACAWRSPRPH